MTTLPAPPSTTALRDRLERHAPLVLFLLYLLAVLLRQELAEVTPMPMIYPDEWRHLELARSVSVGEGLLGRGLAWGLQPLYFPCWLYPLALALPVDLFEFGRAMNVIRWLNALVICLTLPLTYGIAREVTSRPRALAAAALAALLPVLYYIGTLMMENFFLPAVLLALWLALRAIDRPSFARALAAGLAAALTLHIKPHGIILPPILLASALLFEASRLLPDPARPLPRRLARYAAAILRLWPMALGWLLGLLPRLLQVTLIERPGEPISLRNMAGYYYNMGFEGAWDTGRFLVALLANGAGWVIACGVLPAWLLLRALARPGRLTRRERLLAVITATASVLLLVLTARHITLYNEPPIIYERYFIGSVPLALALWAALAGRLGRPSVRLSAAGLLAAGALGLTFLLTQRELVWYFTSNAPSLSGALLIQMRAHLPTVITITALALGVAALAAMVLARGRPWPSLAALALFFIALDFSHHQAVGKLVTPVLAPVQEPARRIARRLAPGDRLLVLADGLSEQTFHQLSFRNRGRMLEAARPPHYWYSQALLVEPDGRIISPYPLERTWLVAHVDWVFNKPPALVIDELALYTLTHPPLSLVRQSGAAQTGHR